MFLKISADSISYFHEFVQENQRARAREGAMCVLKCICVVLCSTEECLCDLPQIFLLLFCSSYLLSIFVLYFVSFQNKSRCCPNLYKHISDYLFPHMCCCVRGFDQSCIFWILHRELI